MNITLPNKMVIFLPGFRGDLAFSNVIKCFPIRLIMSRMFQHRHRYAEKVNKEAQKVGATQINPILAACRNWVSDETPLTIYLIIYSL